MALVKKKEKKKKDFITYSYSDPVMLKVFHFAVVSGERWHDE